MVAATPPGCGFFKWAGIVALRLQKNIAWDGPGMKVPGMPEADRLIRKPGSCCRDLRQHDPGLAQPGKMQELHSSIQK
jgi:hypothetical protein